MLMRAAAKENGWNLNYGGIAMMWRGGCIIRSAFLGKIKDAFDANPALHQPAARPLLRRPRLAAAQAVWRRVVATAVQRGIPVPALSQRPGLLRRLPSERLPANLLQAQRDYFGAHTYERVDRPRGEFFHTNWTGRGGNVSSSTVRRKKFTENGDYMSYGLNIRPSAALDFVALGALNHRVDPGIIPFRKATTCRRSTLSGGEYNVAANLSDCFI